MSVTLAERVLGDCHRFRLRQRGATPDRLERAWAPLLFRDEERPELADPVAPAQRSEAALRKAHTQQLPDGTPVHSFRTLLAELATLTRNQVVPLGAPDVAAFEIVATPTPLQARALALLNLTPVSA